MTRLPLLSLAEKAIKNNIKPLYTRIPQGLISESQKEEFLAKIHEKSVSEDGLVSDIELAELDSTEGVAVYDIEKGILQINLSHPFVAAFQELFQNPKTGLPLEMYAMTEVLTEANLYHMSLEESTIRDILARKDELLRQLVRSSARRTPGMIAMALIDAKDNDHQLEVEMRAAFEAMGFANVLHIGDNGKPDGTAEAYLAASENGKPQRYKVGLEAKSGGSVSAKRLGVSGIAQHMKDYKCDHHVVIGNGFDTSAGDGTTSVKQIKDHCEYTKKTITLMYVDDLARLVRLIPAKRIGFNRLRQLFQTCITPEETKEWIDKLAAEETERGPYKEILEAIWQRADKRPDEIVEYAAILVELEYRHPTLKITKQELIDFCKGMQVMARGVLFARENNVEMNRRPDLILEDIHKSINEYPDTERKTIKL